MTLRIQLLVWVGFFVATIFLLWVFRPILLPFVVASSYEANALDDPKGQSQAG